MEKRDRSSNFTENDKELLLSIVPEYFSAIENKKTDGATVKEKNKAWEAVAEMFNAASTNDHRTWQQLKNSYNNIKRKLKKENADEKVITSGSLGYKNILVVFLEVFNFYILGGSVQNRWWYDIYTKIKRYKSSAIKFIKAPT